MQKNRTPYGLEIIKSCLSCPVREDSLFCQLGPAALAELSAIRQSAVYPKGAVLFMEEQPAHGLFVLCSGKAKLTTSSPQGRSLIVRVAGPGEVLGLSAVMSNATYDVSAETLEPSQTNFLPRDEFLRFLRSYGEVGLRVAKHLSTELHSAYRQLARIALTPTAPAKLASLLLDFTSSDARPRAEGVRFKLPLTHGEIGEVIGCSRETVSRLLTDFRHKGLIQIDGPFITVLDPAQLKALFS